MRTQLGHQKKGNDKSKLVDGIEKFFIKEAKDRRAHPERLLTTPESSARLSLTMSLGCFLVFFFYFNIHF